MAMAFSVKGSHWEEYPIKRQKYTELICDFKGMEHKFREQCQSFKLNATMPMVCQYSYKFNRTVSFSKFDLICPCCKFGSIFDLNLQWTSFRRRDLDRTEDRRDGT